MTDMVVLSACRTQQGAHSSGDDITNLNRGFLYAGSSTVIASLWGVDDAATGVLMQAFYRNLKKGLGKAEALAAAQAATRRQYPNPYYWAAFILTGDPGAIRAQGLPVVMWLVPAVALIVLAVWLVIFARRLRKRKT
jgi:CHAT domain-containing protein